MIIISHIVEKYYASTIACTGSGTVPVESTGTGTGTVPVESTGTGAGTDPVQGGDTGSGKVPVEGRGTGAGIIPVEVQVPLYLYLQVQSTFPCTLRRNCT